MRSKSVAIEKGCGWQAAVAASFAFHGIVLARISAVTPDGDPTPRPVRRPAHGWRGIAQLLAKTRRSFP